MITLVNAIPILEVRSLADTGAQTTGIVVLGIVLVALAITLFVFSQRKRKARMIAEQDAAAARKDAATTGSGASDLPDDDPSPEV
ncbi:MAG: LPXTG cell wall anchor domain-containing protein [Canibacter sp.]